ncbi:MAG: DUF4224 domain-containing protein [Thiobacillaceae bacterium]
MFLTRDDLCKLTGYKAQSRQRRWLQRNGIPHSVNAGGKPVVLVSVVEKMHGISQVQEKLIDWKQVA